MIDQLSRSLEFNRREFAEKEMLANVFFDYFGKIFNITSITKINKKKIGSADPDFCNHKNRFSQYYSMENLIHM